MQEWEEGERRKEAGEDGGKLRGSFWKVRQSHILSSDNLYVAVFIFGDCMAVFPDINQWLID